MNVNHKNKDNNKKRWYVFFTSNYKRSEAKNKKESKWLFTEEKCFVYKLKLSEVCYAEVHLFSPFKEQISICKEMHFSYYTEFSFRTN